MTRLRSEYHQERWRQARALLPHWGPHGPRLRGLRDRETGEDQRIRGQGCDTKLKLRIRGIPLFNLFLGVVILVNQRPEP